LGEREEYLIINMRNIDLIKFIEELLGPYDIKYNLTTSIENDLGITGEDGFDFIKKYSELFNVDISKFVFSYYFHPEPSLFVNYGSVKPLTLGDLENGINNGFLS